MLPFYCILFDQNLQIDMLNNSGGIYCFQKVCQGRFSMNFNECIINIIIWYPLFHTQILLILCNPLLNVLCPAQVMHWGSRSPSGLWRHLVDITKLNKVHAPWRFPPQMSLDPCQWRPGTSIRCEEIYGNNPQVGEIYGTRKMPLLEGLTVGGEKNAIIIDIGTAYTK